MIADPRVRLARVTAVAPARWQKCLLAYAAVLLLMLTGAQRVLGRAPKQVLELVLGGLLIVAFATHPAVSRTLRALGSRATAGAIGVLSFLVVVDAAHLSTRWFYPLVGWEMFTSPMGAAPDPEIFVYTAHHADGSSRRIVPGGMISDAVVSGLDGEAKRTLGALAARPNDAHARAQAESVLRGLRSMEAKANPGEHITSVGVARCRMPVRAPYVPDCRPLTTVHTP